MKVLRRGNLMDICAACWILFITILLMANLTNSPLWQDEAESALNSLTISKASPIPKGAPNDETALLHEMPLYYRADDPKYEYLPTHFMHSPYVTIHGWLPYYFMRMGIGMFGKNEFGPRFFSVVFFALSLVVLYLMLRNNAPHGLALCVVGYCSLMPSLLDYAMQARWYSYALFFSICGLFSFLRYTETKSRAAFAAWITLEAMLYYTSAPAFLVHQVGFTLFLIISRRGYIKSFVLYGSIVCIVALPQIVITKLPFVVLNIPKRDALDLKSLFYVISSLEGNPFLVFSAVTFGLLFIMRTVKKKLWRDPGGEWRFDLLVLLLILIGYLILSYTSPAASFYPRAFIIIVPLIVYSAFSVLLPREKNNRMMFLFKAATLAFMIVFLLLSPMLGPGSSRIPELLTLRFKPDHGYQTDSSWVPQVLRHIKATHVQNPLILTSFEHFVFRYYSDYEAELIWPLRKDFIDSTDRYLFVIAEKDSYLREHCEIFLPLEKDSCTRIETMKFYDRIAGCNETDVSGVRVFECAPRK